MADTATAPAADSGSKRPEKPDEAKFKSDLEQAEKAHKKNQEEFVCAHTHNAQLSLTISRTPFATS